MLANFTSPIAFAESELIAIYNHIPKSLQAHVIEVVLTPYSLSSGTSVTFMTQKNGNYWIIKTENSSGWLFPKAGRIFNSHEYSTLELLFECEGFEAKGSKDFGVKKAAKVLQSFTETEWTLEEKGFLEFGRTSKISLDVQFEQVQEEKEELLNQIETSEQTIKQLKIQLQESENKYFQLQDNLAKTQQKYQKILVEEKQKSLEERQNLLFILETERKNNETLQKNFLQLTSMFQESSKSSSVSSPELQIEQFKSRFADLVNPITQQINQLSEGVNKPRTERPVSNLNLIEGVIKSYAKAVEKIIEKSPDKIDLNDELRRLVDDYNKGNLDNWKQKTLISISRENEKQLRGGEDKLPILKKDDTINASYLAISGSQGSYLVPKPNRIYHTHKMQSILGLFNCPNYKSGESVHKLKLIQPGKLSVIDQEEWKLEENGILEIIE